MGRLWKEDESKLLDCFKDELESLDPVPVHQYQLCACSGSVHITDIIKQMMSHILTTMTFSFIFFLCLYLFQFRVLFANMIALFWYAYLATVRKWSFRRGKLGFFTGVLTFHCSLYYCIPLPNLDNNPFDYLLTKLVQWV